MESCCTTLFSQAPVTASGPHTAAMKSRMMASKSVEFQFVAGVVAVQSEGDSSVTTTRGFCEGGRARVRVHDPMADAKGIPEKDRPKVPDD